MRAFLAAFFAFLSSSRIMAQHAAEKERILKQLAELSEGHPEDHTLNVVQLDGLVRAFAVINIEIIFIFMHFIFDRRH